MRTQTRRAQEMQRLVARWEHSGLTATAFARQCGMSVHTFAWWRHRLRALAISAPLAAPTFTEVRLAAPVAVMAEVVLRTGWVVRVPLHAGVDAAALRTLVAALDAPC